MRAKGFTLAELLVVSVVATGMCVVLAVVIRMGMRTWSSKQSQMTVSMELRRGMHTIVRDLTQTREDQLRLLGGAAWPADGNWYPSIQFTVPQDLNQDGTVLDSSGVIEWSPNPITYRLGGLDGRQLLRGAPNELGVGYGMTGLSFRRVASDPSVVQVQMTVQPRIVPWEPSAPAVTHSTRVRLRN